MARITVLGGTGYAGSAIVREAAARGHQVTAYSRSKPENPLPEVAYRSGDITDRDTLTEALDGADVVVGALSPRGELDGKLVELYIDTARIVQANGARFGVVGGAGSLLIAPGGPTLVETPDFPDAVKPEAAQLAQVLANLRSGDQTLDWFFLSPAGGFGAWAPGEATGVFRLGDDILLTDDNGESNISGADYATAFVNEIDEPAHTRRRFTIAY